MTLISLLTLHPGPAVDVESSKELSDFKDLTRVDHLFFSPCQESKYGFKQEERRKKSLKKKDSTLRSAVNIVGKLLIKIPG